MGGMKCDAWKGRNAGGGNQVHLSQKIFYSPAAATAATATTAATAAATAAAATTAVATGSILDFTLHWVE